MVEEPGRASRLHLEETEPSKAQGAQRSLEIQTASSCTKPATKATALHLGERHHLSREQTMSRGINHIRDVSGYGSLGSLRSHTGSTLPADL
jgi:hypothetical protein